MVGALFLPHNVLVYKADKPETFPGLCSIPAPITSMAPAFIFREFRKLEDIKQKHDTFGLSGLFWSIQTIVVSLGCHIKILYYRLGA